MFAFATPLAGIPFHLAPLTGLASLLVCLAKLLLLVPVTSLALLGTLIVVGSRGIMRCGRHSGRRCTSSERFIYGTDLDAIDSKS